MDVFLKAVAGILITVVLGLTIAKQGKDIAALLVIFVCCMVLAAGLSYMERLVDFLERLEQIGQLNAKMLTVLLKAVGIGIVAEITGFICADTGNAAMGRVVQLLASAVILWLSIPLFEELIQLAQNILEAV